MITTLACGKCGEEVSGPDSASVAETIARHKKEKRHK